MDKFRKMLAVVATTLWFPLAAPAITVKLDYTYDTTSFFPAGSQARATVEAAASYFSTILTDTFNSIQTPTPVASSVSSGLYSWSWELNFNHPNTGALVTLTNQVIPANEYRIYVGARGLGGSLGVGGPGGWGTSSNITGSNSFAEAEIDQINTTNATFGSNVENRGETSGFARWGGALTFNNSVTWNLNHNANPTTGQNDLFSVAIHELGHALGLGASVDWNNLRSGNSFTGAAAVSANGGALVPLSPDGAHWASGKISTIYGTSTSQEAAMDPDITVGTRKRFTTLDAAALTDIGWTLGPAPPFGVPGDYNGNGTVDAADYTRYRDTVGSTTQLTADGDGNGVIGAGDYTYWRNRFGNTAAAIATVSVPEPLSLGQLAVALATFMYFRSERRGP